MIECLRDWDKFQDASEKQFQNLITQLGARMAPKFMDLYTEDATSSQASASRGLHVLDRLTQRKDQAIAAAKLVGIATLRAGQVVEGKGAYFGTDLMGAINEAALSNIPIPDKLVMKGCYRAVRRLAHEMKFDDMYHALAPPPPAPPTPAPAPESPEPE
eukprot:5549766-Pyramimonas_sp.AAC.1